MVEFCKLHNLTLTNTIFKQKPNHQTTWTSPIKVSQQNNRKNPYRNQIDYIIVKNHQNTTVFDSRSYNSITTTSDHKPVIVKISLKWKHSKQNRQKKSINVQKLQNKEISKEFFENVKEMLEVDIPPTSNQHKWNNIVNILNTAAEHTLGYKEHHKTTTIDSNISILSSKQKDLNIQINATKNDNIKKALKIQRNRILTEIHNRLKEEENTKTRNMMKDIELSNNNNKIFETVKNLNKL